MIFHVFILNFMIFLRDFFFRNAIFLTCFAPNELDFIKYVRIQNGVLIRQLEERKRQVGTN